MEYNPSVNYKELHLQWIKKHKSFKPKGGIECDPKTGRPFWNSYYEQMEEMYKHYIYPKTAFICLRDDIKHFTIDQDIDEKVNMVLGLIPTEKYFVTFNFNDNNFDLTKILPALEKLKSKTYIHKMDAVFEYHGSKHNHPHIHMILEVSGPDRTEGRFKKLIRRTQLYNILSADNYLDFKRYSPERHEDYLEGGKKESKLKLLEQDKIWREQLNLQHSYSKS